MGAETNNKITQKNACDGGGISNETPNAKSHASNGKRMGSKGGAIRVVGEEHGPLLPERFPKTVPFFPDSCLNLGIVRRKIVPVLPAQIFYISFMCCKYLHDVDNIQIKDLISYSYRHPFFAGSLS
ncbi:MAG TPA: hypothetical protein VKK79_04520 [Candidatus Lokiarchaeia archaeon]|nr:hypothetical protein [Candidatus Lokiarchaeia archaeon]